MISSSPTSSSGRTTAIVIFEKWQNGAKKEEEECWFACKEAPTICSLIMEVRKSFSLYKKLKRGVRIFDAKGQRVSASSYHRARAQELTIRVVIA